TLRGKMNNLGDISWIMRCAPHMKHFYADTLSRILLSFIPMVELLKRNEIHPSKLASFGAGSCSHEIFLSLIYDRCTVNCYDASNKYIPEYNKIFIDDNTSVYFDILEFSNFDWNSLNSTFDLVISIQTLEHIINAEEALVNLCKTVSNGGYIYIDTPYYSENESLDDPEYLQKENIRQWDVHSHYHLGFSRNKMEERLLRLGFEIIDSGYYSYVSGDKKFLNFIRQSKIFQKTRATQSFIIGVTGMYWSLLQNLDRSNQAGIDVHDEGGHLGRPIEAIRILARKTSDA
ncbi:methyltransferase domain-containing protein, partial [bacterium]|nr:methyltransferase domain-containing protein [bacterium]